MKIDLAWLGFRDRTGGVRTDDRGQVPIEVEVTRVTIREASYITVGKTFSGTQPQWLFLADFQPVAERKKKAR